MKRKAIPTQTEKQSPHTKESNYGIGLGHNKNLFPNMTLLTFINIYNNII
jgi:hypothetical protein